EDSSPNKSYRDEMQFGGDKVFYLSGFIMKKNALLKGLGFGWLP
ncbi:MAG TPA: LysR family transcriptional regulator, partial [Shewanella sp.]|nr:LysR family transcriptional regulator [Shewanella sp.]